MVIEQAINIAKGCVMASFMDSETKQAVLRVLSQVDIATIKTVCDEYDMEHAAYNTPHSYCPNCGQKIDWSEE